MIRGDKRAQKSSARSSHEGSKTFLFILLIAVFHPGWLMAQAVPEALSAKADASMPMAVRILAGRSAIVDTGTPITRVSLTSADIATRSSPRPSSCWCTARRRGPSRCSSGAAPAACSATRSPCSVTSRACPSRFTPSSRRKRLPSRATAATSSSRDGADEGNRDRAVDVAAGFVDKRDEVVSLLQVAPVAGVTNQ